MKPLAFKIYGMDCAEEVGLLKRVLVPLAGSEEALRFDLLNGKLTVDAPSSGRAAEEYRAAIAGTGLRAVPWEEHVSRGAVSQGFAARHGRELVCLFSGGCVSAAFLVHGFIAGWGALLWAPEEASPPYPWLSIVLYAAAILSGGWFIAPKALNAIRILRPDMNLLMAAAVVGALLLGNWLEASLVTFLFAVAQYLESWSIGRARHAITALMDLTPATARYLCPCDGDVMEKPVAEVPLNAIALVRPGERIPLDGMVTKGVTTVNQAPITGESRPVEKGPGDELFAGTINNEGAIEFRVTKAADDTQLARIIRMVEEAQSRRAASEQWVDRFALYYTPLMMGLAACVAVAPPLLFGGAWETWFYQSLVLLLIACPCALVISTPVTIVAGLASAARAGVLIKGGAYLEAPAKIRAIALDKTGTLTLGMPEVGEVVPLNGHTREELLSLAAAIESLSKHPLALAIVRDARRAGLTPAPAESYRAIEGKGAEAVVAGRTYWIGSHRLLRERERTHDEATGRAEALESAGHTVVLLGSENGCMEGEGHVCGLISIADGIRPESRAAVSAMREAGAARVVMLTGDNEGTARELARLTGVDGYRAELLPEDKAAAVRELVARWGAVAMVGDGVNDAPAMATASLGIAMGAAGSDAAIETADIALMSDDLGKIAWLMRHARRTLAVVKQNVVIALGLKLVVLALALMGWATLWLAIVADMGASLIVIMNGLRLLRTQSTD